MIFGNLNLALEAETDGNKLYNLWESFKAFITSEAIVIAILRIVFAFLFLVIGLKLARKFSRKIMNSEKASRISKTMRTFLGHVLKVALYICVVLVTLMILGVNLSAFSVILASAGLTIGLALQGGLSNIAGGVMIVCLKPFGVGDFVEANGVSGTVTDIGIFYTTVTSPDNKKIVVPNGSLANGVITNYSANDTRRIDLNFSVSYSTDIDLAKKVLLSCSKVDERVISDPAPVAIVTEHGESAIKLQLRVWVKKDDYWDVNFALVEQIKRSFDQFGVDIPYPQIDVHMHK